MSDTGENVANTVHNTGKRPRKAWIRPELQSLGGNDVIAASDGPDNDGGELASTS